MYAHYPRVHHSMLTTAIAPNVLCYWLRVQRSNGGAMYIPELFDGLGDATVLPLSCSLDPWAAPLPP